MKYFILAFWLSLFTFESLAEKDTTIVYFDYYGEKTKKKRADSYGKVFLNKKERWTIHKYQMDNTPVMKGTYGTQKLSIKHGFFTYYHSNGEVKSKGGYINDTKQGKWTLWNYLEIKTETGNYTDGEKDGEWYYWSEDGGLLQKGKHQLGSKTGKWQSWHNNGQLKKQGKYTNDEKDGLWEYWYENGQLQEKGTYRDGYKIEEWEQWHETGESRSKGKYNDLGKEIGLWKVLYADGKTDSEGVYVNGKMDKIWRWYFDNGQMSSKEIYNKGELSAVSFWTKEGEVQKVETEVVVDPEFPGGLKEMYVFLGKNLTYPPTAKEMGIQGKVYIRFVVGIDGTIRDIKTLKGIGAGCEEEAVRVIEKMPKWNPGIYHNRKASTKFTIPVSFRLG